ncbi:MAG: DUF3795 domain-containing protein [Promethearchaeota archaeon]
MEKKPLKKYPTIACCGLDCGLCPTYYTEGPSRCPGCCGPDFFDKHPSCSIITCCVKKNGYETCAECDDFPCSKIAKWDLGDSFISHKVSLSNLRLIKEMSIEKFVENQEKRIKLLELMLNQFNDGRSKSFFCIAVTLISIDGLNNILQACEQQIKADHISISDLKSRSKILKGLLRDQAAKDGIELKLRKP